MPSRKQQRPFPKSWPGILALLTSARAASADSARGAPPAYAARMPRICGRGRSRVGRIPSLCPPRMRNASARCHHNACMHAQRRCIPSFYIIFLLRMHTFGLPSPPAALKPPWQPAAACGRAQAGDAVQLLLQDPGGQGGDGGDEERPVHPRHAALGGPVPQHQAAKHHRRAPRALPAHGESQREGSARRGLPVAFCLFACLLSLPFVSPSRCLPIFSRGAQGSLTWWRLHLLLFLRSSLSRTASSEGPW